MDRAFLGSLVALVILLFAEAGARAEPPRLVAIQAPAGGHAIALPDGLVACGGTAGEWTVEGDPHLLRPPALDAAIGHVAPLKVAASAGACAASSIAIDLVATGRLAQIDAASVTLSVDEGRIDLRGRGLRGAGVHWQEADRAGDDRCAQPDVLPAGGAAAGVERCSYAVARGLSADGSGVTLSWFPAGGRAAGPEVATFDASGRSVTVAELTLRPARFLVSSLVPSNVAIDLVGDASRIPLTHPEAVASADCGSANCELDGRAIVVRAVRNLGQSLAVRVRLAPHVFFVRGDKTGDTVDAAPSFQVAVLPCAMTIASGDALRGVDDSSVVVKLDPRCAAEAPSLRFLVGTQAARVLRIAVEGGAAFVVLRVGRLEGDELAVTAVRGDADASVVGVARTRTRSAPQPRATLELEKGGKIDFIPTNRSAIVRFASTEDHARLVLLPLDGVYEALAVPGATAVRGLKGAAGFVQLRFAYRIETLPGALATTDLAILSDPVELALKEANVPAAIGASAATDKQPLVELLCGDGGSGMIALKPGTTTHIAYAARDTCRLVFHKERLSPEDGAQRLNLAIDVTRVDGEARPEGHVSQPIVLRPEGEPRYSYIKGVKGQFDRVTVSLSQDNDESHYVSTGEVRVDAPAVQWTIIAGQGHARIYATTAIPTGLYRVSDRAHSGILTLNFGAIGRLTWLDGDGHDGFVGLEAGVMAVGLPNDTSGDGTPLTQVATVCGVGLSVPIANRSLATETSINLHAWFEYEISRDIGQEPGNPLGFVFGPSISIGNVGANL